MGRKSYTGERPRFWRTARMYLNKILFHFFTFMIRCIIPQNHDSLVRVFLTQCSQKCDRCITITARRWHNGYFAVLHFCTTKLRLSLPKVGHRDRRVVICTSPDIPTRIIPQEMTFISIHNKHLTRQHSFMPCGKIRTYLFFFAAIVSASRFGLRRCAFFHVIRASWSKSY